MTTTFKHAKGRITVTLSPEAEKPLELSLNVEAAIEWREGLDRCIAEAGQAKWATATKRRKKVDP